MTSKEEFDKSIEEFLEEWGGFINKDDNTSSAIQKAEVFYQIIKARLLADSYLEGIIASSFNNKSVMPLRDKDDG